MRSQAPSGEPADIAADPVNAGPDDGNPEDVATPSQAERMTPDIVTDETIGLLRRDGLIARQAELNEGLVLMDRRLRQAQIVGQVMRVFGPDEPIEVAPGRFVDFSDTPEGMRQRIEMINLQLRLMESERELAEALNPEPEAVDAVQELSPADLIDMMPARLDPVVDDPAEQANDVPPVPSEPAISDRDLTEITGANGSYTARITLQNRSVVVQKGDSLPTGQLVADVTMTTVVLANPDGSRQTLSVGE
jgi:type IV pilus biogenesis protein PilP